VKILLHRPARTAHPPVRPQAQTIAAPPQLPAGPAGGLPVQTLLPVVGALSSMTMMLVMRGANPLFLVVGALVFVVALTSGLAMAFTSRARATRERKHGRERYLDYLEEFRTTMAQQAAQVRMEAMRTNPEPAALPQFAADPARVWERRPGDEDFLRVRIGLGTVPWFDLTTPHEANPVQPLDPLLMGEAEQAARTCSLVDDMPLWVDLARGGDVAIIGEAADTENLARAMLVQTAVLHSPDDVRIAAVFSPDRTQAWSGIDHLPHTMAFTGPTGVPRFLVATSIDKLVGGLSGDIASRVRRVAARRHSGTQTGPTGSAHLIVFIDGHGTAAQRFPVPEEGYTCADLGITVVHLIDDRLDEPPEVGVRIYARHDQIEVQDLSRHNDQHSLPATGRTDRVSAALLDIIARDLTPLTLTSIQTDSSSVHADTVSALQLLGVTDVGQLSPSTAWRPRSTRDFLRVPIGVDDHGAPLLLDLKESAHMGMGPHGICVGATGSGKSELLRMLVLSLAATHSPEDLSMILVDYKGGAAFAPFAQLAHVAGLIDNLADDPQLTRRARESIAGEVLRRQEMLKTANSAASISHYRQMRAENPSMPPMPHLFIVIDEFGELLTAEPEFSDLLLKIGRIGRSIGVHLLLASQRIEGGMLRGLDTYLSYWIGMRTFSEAESRTILNTPDAFTLPNIPGYGYLKVDTSVYTRFRAGYVSGPVRNPDAEAHDDTTDEVVVQTVPLFAPPETVTFTGEEQVAPPDVGHLLVDEVVARLTATATTDPVWLPPLPPRVSLGSLLSEDVLAKSSNSLQIPVGILDDPAHQAQTPWMLDLAARGGHIGIIGAPQTGRATFLRTIAVSLALTHTPRQVSIYGIDLTGGGLDRIEGFPHVGGVASRTDKAKLTRLLEELQTMITTRETLFRDRHIDSVTVLRQAHARDPIPGLVAPDVIILVDGVDPIRNEFDELDQPFTHLLQRGGTFGIHVIMTLTRWNELRSTLAPLVGQRYEMRLNDPGDSTIQRAAAQALKSVGPGRALTQDLLYGQVALPLLDDIDDDADIGETIASIATRSTAAWSGPAAAPIRLLPDTVDPGELPDEYENPAEIPIGIRQDTFEALCFAPKLDQHLLVFGDAQCGKTTLLMGIVRGFIARHTPDELVFAVIDPRGTLAAVIPDEYLGGAASSAKDAQALSSAIAHELEKRTTDKTATFPRVVVLVDDYDIVAAGGTQPLNPLLAYLPSARDLQLSVILTRPVSGAGRAMMDQAISSLRDTGGSGLVMNGEHSEGPIFPKVYAEAMPPGRGRYIRRGTTPRIIQVARFQPL